MRKNADTPRGNVHKLTFLSEVLRGNLLGDPVERDIDVYIPAGHDGRGLPLLVDLVGYTAGGPAHTAWKNFQENVPERADRLIASGTMAPCVIAFPDCFTRLGGNQYINSAAMGRWDDFLLQEAVPFVEQRFACGSPGRRGVFGKSSGGFGAMNHAMLHSDFWSAAASHSGDIGHELMYFAEFPNVLRALAKHGNSIEKWMVEFESAKKKKDSDIHILMVFAMAASYDPDPSQYLGLRLPVTLDTCERIQDRWRNWLKWDPLSMAQTHAEKLKNLKLFYFDCGDVDQYQMIYGSRRLHRLLEAKNISHIYEEFPDNHSGVDYRMDVSLPLLSNALS